MKQRFKFIPAVYLILRDKKSSKILLSRRHNTGYMDGYYSMVAGHLEGDEPLTVALAREATEEVGITINPADLKLVNVMHLRSEIEGTTDDERVTFYFETDTFEGTIQNMEPHKCDALEWFDPNDLPTPIIDHVEIAIRNSEKGVVFSEYGW